MTDERKTAFDAEKAREGRAVLRWLLKTGGIIAALMLVGHFLGLGTYWIFRLALFVLVSRLVLAIFDAGSNSPRRQP